MEYGEPIEESVSTISWNLLFIAIGLAFLLAFLIALPGTSFGGNPSADFISDSSIALLLVVGLAFLVMSFRVPYRIVLSDEVLTILHFHRRESIPMDRIASIELRGDFVSKNVWLVYSGGKERPLGVRSRKLVRAWEERFAAKRHLSEAQTAHEAADP